MKVVHVTGAEYRDHLYTYDQYERYDDGSSSDALFIGYNASLNESIKSFYSDYERKSYINQEAPCSFFTTDNAITSQEYFDRVFTICPYTAKWMNGKGKTQYIPVLQPYNEDMFVKYRPFTEKTKDVFYQGGLYSPVHAQMIDMMKGYNYVFTSLFRNDGVTHRKISSVRKWDLLASSKCSIGINLLYPSKGHIANIKTYDDWSSNEAFRHESLDVIPQMKTRVIEAAICGTLNLVMRDDWNVIEHWFNTDEFIYWDTIEDLKSIIDDVIINYRQYEPIVERAYQKVLQYSIPNFLKREYEGDINSTIK